MNTPRVIATDLDRTLLASNGTLTERTRAALTAARNAGAAIVAVTARPPRAFEIWTDLASHLDAAICAGGTICYQPENRTAITVHTLDPETAALAAKTLLSAIPGLYFAVETGHEVIAEPGYAKIDNVLDRRRIAPTIAHVLATAPPFVKLLAYLPNGDIEKAYCAAQSLHLPDVSLWHSGSRDQLELGPAGVDKAQSLAAWCAEHGVGPADVVAFGDAPADAPMLAWAGQSFAVADGHPVAVAAATDQCGASTDDGVAAAIEMFLR